MASENQTLSSVLDDLLCKYGPRRVREALEALLKAAAGLHRYYDWEEVPGEAADREND